MKFYFEIEGYADAKNEEELRTELSKALEGTDFTIQEIKEDKVIE